MSARLCAALCALALCLGAWALSAAAAPHSAAERPQLAWATPGDTCPVRTACTPDYRDGAWHIGAWSTPDGACPAEDSCAAEHSDGAWRFSRGPLAPALWARAIGAQ